MAIHAIAEVGYKTFFHFKGQSDGVRFALICLCLFHTHTHQVQAQGGIAALIDAEHAFDPQYAAALGAVSEDLIICQPENGEMALEVADQLARSNAVDLIAVDSVAALVPKAEIEGEIGLVQVWCCRNVKCIYICVCMYVMRV